MVEGDGRSRVGCDGGWDGYMLVKGLLVMKVYWICGASSVVFYCNSNHVEIFIRVERQPPVRAWSIDLMLVLLKI
uniref:DUF3778 domain-containing protein n=1 Tax=Oryza sativa subsp. japonica TaxID=39947 RepID=Q6UUG0_ORYSJ|nr:hypothetical protein OSJNBa0038J12.9 [Oryza sativa Japonica Group]